MINLYYLGVKTTLIFKWFFLCSDNTCGEYCCCVSGESKNSICSLENSYRSSNLPRGAYFWGCISVERWTKWYYCTICHFRSIIRYDLNSFSFLGAWTRSGWSYFESWRSWSCFSAKGGLSFCLICFSANSCFLYCFSIIRTILTEEMKLVIFWAWLKLL